MLACCLFFRQHLMNKPKFMAQKTKRISHLAVGTFFKKHGDQLKLELLNQEVGLDRKICEPAINRPGLALAGFFTYFAKARVQVMGHSELSYLEKQTSAVREERLKEIFSREIPCLVLARKTSYQDEIVNIANSYKTSVFCTELSTMQFANRATFLLENEFAETTTIHGCMLNYRGIGILIMGKSGSGKSEAAIGLVEKGAALVADDLVRVSKANGKLNATSDDFTRGFIEMRGVGIINAANLFGLGAICPECELDLIVFLRPHSDLNEVDRVGLQRERYDIMDIGVPYVEIPVGPGRDTARMISVTALDLQLRRVGYDMAEEFNQRILDKMNGKGAAFE